MSIGTIALLVDKQAWLYMDIIATQLITLRH